MIEYQKQYNMNRWMNQSMSGLSPKICLLTNNNDIDSSIVSCADCVDRNTGVHSIVLNGVIEHTWEVTSNTISIKIKVIIAGGRIGIRSAIKWHWRST